MKTTIDIADGVFSEARKLAHEEHTTFKALVEEGLRHIVETRKQSGPFRLRKASFKGQGLHPDLAEGSWDRVRAAVYHGRGG